MSDKIVLFMASNGILVAILLVLAQLWIVMAKEYKDNRKPTITAGYGLSYCYYAIFTSMLSFAITIIAYSLTPLALVLFTYSISSAVILVYLIAHSVVIKTLLALPFLEPLPIGLSVRRFNSKKARVIFLFIAPGLLFLFCWLAVYSIPWTKIIFERFAS